MPSDLRAAFDVQRAAFSLPDVPPPRERIAILRALENAIRTRRARLVAAVNEDFGHRAEMETLSSEIAFTLTGIRHLRKHLKAWAKPRRGWSANPVPGRTRVLREPKGVVGIMSPWNYPLQLALVPLATALAAGNRVMLKPSERSPASSEALAELLGDTFGDDLVAVALGGPDVAAAFSALPFDHLFFTGSTETGRKVAEAAARNLTPVTLELGGKSPCVMMPDAVPEAHASLAAWGKWFSAGQTCVAPDYLLVPEGSADAWAAAMLDGARAFLDPARRSADYTSLIDASHAERLQAMLAEAEAGGARILRLDLGSEPRARQMAPTVVLHAARDSRLMTEEVFGPVLPIVEYRDLGHATASIAKHPDPLALYAFGTDAGAARRFAEGVRSGGAAVNAAILHLAVHDLPFGGIGRSGMGAYHGERGFLEFSHQRSILVAPQSRFLRVLIPPYDGIARRMIERMAR